MFEPPPMANSPTQFARGNPLAYELLQVDPGPGLHILTAVAVDDDPGDVRVRRIELLRCHSELV